MGKRKKVGKKKTVSEKPFTIKKLKQKDDAGNEKRFYSNVMEITPNDFEDHNEIIDRIQSLDKRHIQYYLDKQYPKFPRAYQIILQTSDGEQTFEKANKMSAPDKSVNIDNIVSDIEEAIENYAEGYNEALEAIGEENLADSDWVFNPDNIVKIFIRFIYAL